MREWTKLYVALGFVAALAVAGLSFQIVGYGAVSRLTEAVERNQPMSQMTATWTSGGISHTVTTTRRENESAEDFARRHQEELNAALALFPKDP